MQSSQKLELTLRITTCKQEQNTGDGASTLGLKSMGRVNQNPKQRVPVGQQDEKFKKLKFRCYYGILIWAISGNLNFGNVKSFTMLADLC